MSELSLKIDCDENPLTNLCKDISLSRLKNHSTLNDLSIGALRDKNSEVEISQWLSLIFIKSEGLKISFKSKYHIDNIKHFAANGFLTSPSDLTKSKIDDFTKEFCNLTAGGIKAQIEKIIGSSEISLPLLTRWDDNVFFIPNELDKKNNFIFQDEWEIYLDSDKNRYIQCFLSIELYNEKDAKALLAEKSFIEEEDDGEIDFF